MQAHLNLLVKGFQLFEQRIIEATVRLSQNRIPSLSLLADTELADADVIIIDASDTTAMQWASANQQALENQIVIWVDAETDHAGNDKHTVMARPILWVNLPIIITRILDDQAVKALARENLAAEMAALSKVDSPATDLLNVLVVDDSKAVRDYLANILIKCGYHVVTADSGEVAIEHANRQRFDCVLMDVLMPGIDGYKACREIRRLQQYGTSVPVIMLTSRTSPFDKIRGKMAGCSAYLTKPVKINTLLDAIKQYTHF